MAGLSDVNAGEGPIPPETLKKLLAAYQANPTLQVYEGEGESGPRYTGAPGTAVDGYELRLDPNTGKPLISKGISHKTWGKDKAAVYNMDGSFNGYSSGDSEALSMAKFVAGSVGGYYGAGALNAAAGTTAATGAGSLATTDIGIGAAAAGGGGGAATAAGSGLQAGGLMEAMGGTSAVGGGTATTAGTTAASGLSSAVKTVADAAKAAVASNGFDQLVKIGTGVVGATLAGDALSDPVDTSRYDKLFDNLLNEQALASQRGKDLWADYTNIWKPAQQKFADTAMNHDTAGRREQAANEASGLVATEYDQKRSAATRDMQMAGVDPSTISALGAASQAWEAKDRAGAQNQARDGVEKTGLNLLKGLVDQGNVVQNQATQQSQIATGTTTAAGGLLNAQANIQNQNTANRNAVIGDLFKTGGYIYGLSDAPAKKTGT